MENDQFVVLIRSSDEKKYLFNRRMLVADIAFARRFHDLTQAKHYFSKSMFAEMRYQIEPVTQEDPPVDPRNPGAIVE